MSKKEWFILWLLFIAYLFMGASIFYTIERQLEEERRNEAKEEQKGLKELLEKQFTTEGEEIPVDDLANKLSVYCDRQFALLLSETNITVEENSKPYLWTYYNSFFFSLTTISTIGYGNLYPSSDGGKILVIFYALIGIPFNGIILAQLGEFFGSVFLRAHHRYKNHVYESRISLILDILVYLILGIVIFIFAPAFLFAYCESWSFIESIYYAFITLTTIGFGDLVAGQSSDPSPGDTIYKIFLLFWIMFGLGYLVMILGFIARAMKSKRINKFEQKLAHTIKQTQSKIWNEFIQDVNYIRRAINEAYINKVKPIYVDKTPLLEGKRLTVSCPNLSEWPVLRPKYEIEQMKEDEEETMTSLARRRRAFSENYTDIPLEHIFPRVMSEGALGNIDKAATFRDRPRPSLAPVDLETEGFLHNLIHQRKLSMQQDHDEQEFEDGGIHLFSDDEILHSEQYSTKGSSSTWVGPKRTRASSEVPYLSYTDNYDRQNTWSGVASLHDKTMFNKMRAKSGEWERGDLKEDKDHSSPANSFRRLSMAAVNFFSGTEKKKKLSKDKLKKERRTGNTFLNSPGHRLSLQENDMENNNFDNINYLSQNGRRPSLLDMLPSSTGANTPMSPVLEQTSLADFIRVMSTLRKLEEQQDPPKENQQRQNDIHSRHPSLSYLFKPLPREVMRTKQTSASTGNLATKDRRFSLFPQRNDLSGIRKRAASISPVINEPQRGPVTGRFTPPSKTLSPPPIPPTVVVTSPDGHHRFSVHNVASPRNEGLLNIRRKRRESLSEIITKP